MDIENIDLLALQTRQMQADPTTQGLCAGLNAEIRKLAPEIQKCLGLLLLYIAPELVTDEAMGIIAYDLKVDWYDDSQPRDARIETILNSKKIYHMIGTPSALEWAIAPYFRSAIVREWFEYDGEPLHYKIFAQGELSAAQSALLYRVIGSTARLGAVLDAVAMIILSTGTVHTGGQVVARQKVVIREA